MGISALVNAQHAITVDTIQSINAVLDIYPSVSPDGSKIAFHSNRMGHNDIYVMNVDGSELKRLTDHPANDRTPSWSPDGEHIVFVSTRDGNYNVFIMNKDGRNQKNLTNHVTQKDIHPYWSPDGKKILFNSSRVNDTYQLYVMNTDGSDQRLIQTKDGESTHAQFSKDGKRIVFRRFLEEEEFNSEIFVMNADGTGDQRLTKRVSVDYAPAWSPDGKRIVFVSDQGTGSEALFVMDITTLETTQITWPKAGEQHMTPVWLSENQILYSHMYQSACSISLISLHFN